MSDGVRRPTRHRRSTRPRPRPRPQPAQGRAALPPRGLDPARRPSPTWPARTASPSRSATRPSCTVRQPRRLPGGLRDHLRQPRTRPTTSAGSPTRHSRTACAAGDPLPRDVLLARLPAALRRALDTMWAGIRRRSRRRPRRPRHPLPHDPRRRQAGDDGAAAVELVEFAAAQDRDQLIGVGGDNDRARHRPPRVRAGVHARRPASACAARCTAARTGRPTTSASPIEIARLRAHRPRRGAARRRRPDRPGGRRAHPADRVPDLQRRAHRHRAERRRHTRSPAQRAAGVLVTINSDDPGHVGHHHRRRLRSRSPTAFRYDFADDGPARPRRHRGQLGARRREAGTPQRFGAEIAALRNGSAS